MNLPTSTLLCALLVTAVVAVGQTDDPVEDTAPAVPADPTLVLSSTGTDTLRTNLEVAQALMGAAVIGLEDELPPPPAVMVLVPASTEAADDLLTDVAYHHLTAAGYEVHIDQRPAGTDLAVYEFRYRIQDLSLAYPTSGRRLLFWKSWVGRQMDIALQISVVAAADGQVILSRRVAQGFQDRVPVEYVDAVESTAYPFTTAAVQQSGSSRRIEQIVVLGALVGLVAIYFANAE